MKKTDWQKILRFQEKDGWCGPAVIQMALAASGIKKSQRDIAKDVCLDWFGTSQDMMYAYLSRFLKSLDFQKDSSLDLVAPHLKTGHVVIVNWWDDIDLKDVEGHYSLILDYDKGKNKITLGDPQEGRGIWEIGASDFVSTWYDYLDTRNTKKVSRWMLWLDPKSRI